MKISRGRNPPPAIILGIIQTPATEPGWKKGTPAKKYVVCLVSGTQRGPRKSKNGKRGDNSGEVKCCYLDPYSRKPSFQKPIAVSPGFWWFPEKNNKESWKEWGSFPRILQFCQGGRKQSSTKATHGIKTYAESPFPLPGPRSTDIASNARWYSQGNRIIPGFLSWCRLSSIYSTSICFLAAWKKGEHMSSSEIGSLKQATRDKHIFISANRFTLKPKREHANYSEMQMEAYASNRDRATQTKRPREVPGNLHRCLGFDLFAFPSQTKTKTKANRLTSYSPPSSQ